jgi:glycosyltransferase involved in cell wall biosynthesis
MLDAIVTVSHFIRSACDTTLDGVLTIPADFPLHLPTVGPLRERFQLPSDRSIFVTSFEAYGAERKNPLATVEAFRRAFPDGHQALLVIRINNASDGVPHPVVVRLREQCANDRRFRLIENALSYRDVLTLYASCDVLISLHRSEGLGLALMEAMALGKPVIATAWSGNMTYMTTMNSCLVTYRLVPVKTTLDVYAEQVLGRHALWAEPDVDDAAAWMARLATDGSLRSRIGARAAESMARREAKAELGTFLDELVAIHDQYAFLPSFQSKKARLVAVEPQFLANDKRRGLRSYVGRTLQRHILRRVADWSQRE